MIVAFDAFAKSANANGLKLIKSVQLSDDHLSLIILSDVENSMEHFSTTQSFKDWKASLEQNSIFYLSLYDNMVHCDFYTGIGSLNIAMVLRYVSTVKDKLKIVEGNWTARQTYLKICHQFNNNSICIPVMNSTYFSCAVYSSTVQDYVNALYKAKWFGFFDFNDFDLYEYETQGTVHYGDTTWIVPGRLLAFSTPHSVDGIDNSGYPRHSPAYYYHYFKENHVKHVIRLNRPEYDGTQTFVSEANITHADILISNGAPPSDSALSFFLCLCDHYVEGKDPTNVQVAIDQPPSNGEINVLKYRAAIAVHCQAGLGRTGIVIASYITKHWTFTALEAISWVRLCRPSSVNSAQQQWLIKKEKYLKLERDAWRMQRNLASDQYVRFTHGLYSLKRHGSNADVYRFINSPLPSSLIKNVQLTVSSCSSMLICCGTLCSTSN